ncbi:MAG: hypothetical protein V1755_04890 [Chloroflexota bacterium]
MKTLSRLPVSKLITLAATAVLLYGALLEFYNIAWGTGTWYGEFSLKWGVAFVLLILVCAGIFSAWAVLLWRRSDQAGAVQARRGSPVLRGFLGALVVATPICLLQYSPWGVVIDGPYLRILLWAVCVATLSMLIAPDPWRWWTQPALLAAILLCGSAYVGAAALTEVTAYPFSLGWSEGNRLWDYSLLFGRRLYSFESEQQPSAYLDFGRQLIGGLPFLLPGVSILGARLWLAAVSIVPYLLLGLLAFWPHRRKSSPTWILAGLLGFIFLSQGPIHAPLLICATLVALAWRLPVWWAAPLIAIAGYFAETSRFTWMFAPGIWAVLLEIGGGELTDGRLALGAWRRAIILGCAGLLGSALAYTGVLSWSETSVGSTAAVSTSQALLWYRLLPNATYGDGILFGLAKAAAPLIAVLVYAGPRYWKPHPVQILTPTLSLIAFLTVGLVISTKIGGGGDLHNLDMFLIGVLFTAAVLWRTAAAGWMADVARLPGWMHALIMLMLAIPAYGPLLSLRPLNFSRHVEWLSVLADAERPRDLGSLPEAGVVDASLEELRRAVQEADRKGQVLFMDQRQLLTFGYVEDIELISQYEKKRMMDEALSGNTAYFEPFYRDLASNRFSLLVSSPLRTPIKDSDYGFGEENNAWVKWVARPVLCYYEEKNTLDEVKVELLVPRTDPVDCSSALPQVN